MIIALNILHGTTYIPLPASVKVRSMTIVAQATPGVAGSVTLSKGATAVNVASAAGATAGVPAAGVPDAANGALTFVGGTDPIKLVATSTNSVAFGVVLDVDEFLIL